MLGFVMEEVRQFSLHRNYIKKQVCDQNIEIHSTRKRRVFDYQRNCLDGRGVGINILHIKVKAA